MMLQTDFSFLAMFWSCPIWDTVFLLLRAARPMFLRLWWISWFTCSLTVCITSLVLELKSSTWVLVIQFSLSTN